MPSPKRERKILIDLDAQPMPLPDVVVSDRPELIVDLGNLRPPSEIKEIGRASCRERVSREV